jgi:hypothetical protein
MASFRILCGFRELLGPPFYLAKADGGGGSLNEGGFELCEKQCFLSLTLSKIPLCREPRNLNYLPRPVALA